MMEMESELFSVNIQSYPNQKDNNKWAFNTWTNVSGNNDTTLN